MRVFLAVAEENGFSAGARRIGIPQSSASRQIANLERRIGTKLFQRSTRRLNLTPSGEIFLERVHAIISEIDAATASLSTANSEVAGLLRVSMPAAFGRCCVLPLLQKFRLQNPEVAFGLSMTDEVQDMVQLGFDVAIRIGALPDSSMIARRLTASSSLLCASPAYLDRRGRPAAATDLSRHDCLQFRTTPGQNVWHLKRGDQAVNVKVSGPLYCDSGDTLLSAAEQGLGVAFLPRWLVQRPIDSGRLEVVLPDHEDPSPSAIHALYPTRNFVPRKVTAFVDFLAEELRRSDL
ncbi:Transcriptional regulator, LysR family [Candidatus Rhodobacter oscarellae]|uniref:Transcriptional regulator, LysR family n=1 Tax=Candidatus Rhodobacter oscarellae TaxID=1675527 RepID=A0A0J9EBA0_9RHOB|nr:LysR family transcriptional regulator [Candidatus Rhodobacter lobularis]KMW60060.1 Transcriptional regulator, LysR family [Candidatus Rhodobacter lobularis]